MISTEDEPQRKGRIIMMIEKVEKKLPNKVLNNDGSMQKSIRIRKSLFIPKGQLFYICLSALGSV